MIVVSNEIRNAADSQPNKQGDVIREYIDEVTGITIRARGMKTLAFIVDGHVITKSSPRFQVLFHEIFYRGQ